ncbi:uncharacterized protein BO95DRAFT_275263 [Aspergillus brunneoviolaceus CBS 621.78]|uniref:Uncharacterized protein n=1 Tax=Aspergillus brunneoviolaceus CBS 621.78 TaxID=1450534 RepID=A0ACD1FWB7_9EURO|nr:hypothetical protein BO95DRAFT_275263 [Aspergillus brunneoviolaceus CBS 621.78]RAH41235.1 hypothetical protein BO95DRAFT_275263 [Aspergillus brunneoviolaceus CBS 621.78]
MDFPWPPPSPPSGSNDSLADELPDYSTSPTAWLAAVARKVYPASDCYHEWDIQITTEAAAPASSSEDHRSTPRCDVITISHSASRTVLILVAGPDDDEVSLESPRSEAEEKADAAVIIWQRRRACLQQQWERHNLGDESDETKAPSIHGAVLVRGQIILGSTRALPAHRGSTPRITMPRWSHGDCPRMKAGPGLPISCWRSGCLPGSPAMRWRTGSGRSWDCRMRTG